MDQPTVDTYERGARAYLERRKAYNPERAEEFRASLPPGSLRLDLGSGPGHYLPHLGRPVVAADAAHAMAQTARAQHQVPAVTCEVSALPFRRGGLDGIWASKVLQHIPAPDLPMALAEMHRVLRVDGVFDVTLFATDVAEGTRTEVTGEDDDFPGRLFTFWRADALERLLVGAGFEVATMEAHRSQARHRRLTARVRRARTLPDTVGPGMRLLVCGLNPSIYAADAGVGFARPGNRFWPAARQAGLVTVDRDVRAALRDHGMGMTDLVKRATVAADELTNDEYRAGLERVEHLVSWLRPGAVCFVGLAGWRAAVDRKAKPGPQPDGLGGVPVYVMPSTSGLNARTQLDEHVRHLRSAAALASPET